VRGTESRQAAAAKAGRNIGVSHPDRDAGIKDLQQRLAEAEETLRAIYHGAVDALVIRGPDGPQVFTLRSAQEPYRALVEHMNEGALTVSADGAILYSNRHFADLLEHPLEQIAGKPLAAFVAPHEKAALEALLADGARRSVRRELSFVRSDRSMLPALAAVGPLVIDDMSALLLIVTDLTAQKQSEEVAAAERFARSILEQATDTILVCDRAGRITKTSWAAERLLNRPLVGQAVVEAVPFEVAAGEEAASLGAPPSATALLDAVLAGKSVQCVEARIGTAELSDRHFLLSGGPLYDHGEQSIGCILTLTDITDRKRAEEHQTVLMAELNHRVKNILAIVQSVAWQTVSNSRSMEVFKDGFDGRLKAISLAHDILTQIRRGQVDLKQLVAQSLSPYSDPDNASRVSWSGPALLLAEKAVVPLSMVLHELSTNAAKYGAFSSEAGTVEIRWRLLDDGRDVELTWVERNGPPVDGQAATSGFGTKLISRVISYDLHGRADLDFDRTGLRCMLSFPVPVERRQPLATASRVGGNRRGEQSY
jgi:PAS domain S-box-containing protein